jgi:hypothetical protein
VVPNRQQSGGVRPLHVRWREVVGDAALSIPQ